MLNKYRVVTTNFNGSISVMTDWMWWRQAVRFILGRWGHWPPFAHITRISSYDKLARRYGFEV